MLYNDNNYNAYNDYLELPFVPYKIVEVLIKDESEASENLWKLLKYSDIDCLSKPNLTRQEKKSLLWQGDSIENDCRIFLKPLNGSSTESADSQTQIRLFRSSTMPTNRIESILCYEIDFLTNEKACLVKYKNMIVEKTDLMESLFLQLMVGRDIKCGTTPLTFDRELSRSCNSQLTISNSKSFYGRSLVMGLLYINPTTDRNECG